MENVALYNLGCKVNAYEMEVMRQMLQEKGYGIVSFDEMADIYIVNTCTVTNIADRKSRQMLHRAKRQNPEAVVVAVGCYVQLGQEEVERDGCIDLAIGNSSKKDIVPILEAYLKERRRGRQQGHGMGGGAAFDADRPEAFDRDRPEAFGRDRPVASDGDGAADSGGESVHVDGEVLLKGTAEHTRAYIKIQDGCNQFCSYCAIPYARGRVRSRRAEEVLREVDGLAQAGYLEVVLTGIHISSYGIDLGEGCGGLVELVELVHGIPGLERIRLGSLEPRIITPEAAERLAALPKLCPHFHLSLQSGCDATLKRMNRRYTAGEYYRSVELLRERFGEPAVTTDVIVGFPGETEEEFAQTKRFVERVGFYEMHVFQYSKRAGTVAASLPVQVPAPVKAARSAELLALRGRQSLEFRRRYLGRRARVLLEETRLLGGRTYCIGHTEDYVKVAVDVTDLGPREAPAVNTLIWVTPRDFLTEEILV